MFVASYDDGEECPEELVVYFTVAQWSSNTVRDTITRFGAKILEVGLTVVTIALYCCNALVSGIGWPVPGVR